MKTYELVINGVSKYFKTEAESATIEQAIAFVKAGVEPSLDKVLVAIRMLGFKATPVTIDPVDVFEV